jgi:transcriptional regulator with XRE-family HTH domain
LHNALCVHSVFGIVETLADRLRWARETAGLTTRALAERAKVSIGYPSALECNVSHNPSAERLRRIADVLGVSFEWLCWGTGKAPSETSLRRRGANIRGAA